MLSCSHIVNDLKEKEKRQFPAPRKTKEPRPLWPDSSALKLTPSGRMFSVYDTSPTKHKPPPIPIERGYTRRYSEETGRVVLVL